MEGLRWAICTALKNFTECVEYKIRVLRKSRVGPAQDKSCAGLLTHERYHFALSNPSSYIVYNDHWSITWLAHLSGVSVRKQCRAQDVRK